MKNTQSNLNLQEETSPAGIEEVIVSKG